MLFSEFTIFQSPVSVVDPFKCGLMEYLLTLAYQSLFFILRNLEHELFVPRFCLTQKITVAASNLNFRFSSP